MTCHNCWTEWIFPLCSSPFLHDIISRLKIKLLLWFTKHCVSFPLQGYICPPGRHVEVTTRGGPGDFQCWGSGTGGGKEEDRPRLLEEETFPLHQLRLHLFRVSFWVCVNDLLYISSLSKGITHLINNSIISSCPQVKKCQSKLITVHYVTECVL